MKNINCVINDISLPELQEWKVEIGREDERIYRLNGGNDLSWPFADTKSGTHEEEYTDEEDDYEIVPQESIQIATRSVKAGRNDPCPCGSGKKYKKCCGK